MGSPSIAEISVCSKMKQYSVKAFDGVRATVL